MKPIRIGTSSGLCCGLVAVFFATACPVWADDATARADVGLERITVTATGSPKRLYDVPQLTTTVSGDDIRRRAARSTPEALQEEVGILVQETNLGGGSPFIRGQTGHRVLVLVDGIRLNNSTFRFGPNQYLNTIDPFTIDQIDVVRGPSSVLYGSDALGGVINIITRRRDAFSDPIGVDARTHTRVGSAAFEKTLRADASANAGNFGVVGGFTYRNFDDLRSGAEKQDHTGYDELNGDLRLQYRFADDHELAVAFQRVDQNDVPRTGAFNNGDSLYFDPQRRALYALEHRLGDLGAGFHDWRSSLSYHDQQEVRRRFEARAQRRRREEDRVGTIGFTSQLEQTPIAWQTFVGGVETYFDDVESTRRDTNVNTGVTSDGRSTFPDGTDYSTLGLFLQSESQLGDALDEVLPVHLPLTLIIGGRYSRFAVESAPAGFDEVEQDFDHLTGSVAMMYDLSEYLRLVGSVAQGFRAPNLDDTVVLREEPDLGIIDSPNPDLEPEEVLNYEGGFKWEHPYVGGELVYFYSDYDNLIERVTQGNGFDDENGNGAQDLGELTFAQRRNVGEARIQGVELALRAPLVGGLDARGQYSWIHGENTTADEPVRRIPPMLGRAGLYYAAPRDPYWLEGFVQVAGEQDRLAAGDRGDVRICPDGPADCDGTDAWYTLNLRGGWSVMENLELQLALENLTDQTYRWHGSGLDAAGFNAVAGVTWSF